MAQAPNNASRARAVLRDAIHSGLYPGGTSLPSSRELATQFGINRNTATKIYHELADDRLVDLVPYRPPVVTTSASERTTETLQERLRDSLHQLLLECRLVGLTADDTRRLLVDVVDEFFSTYRYNAIFVAECNDEEARGYAQDITRKLGIIVQPVLLSQLHPDFPADIILTPYFHLQEAREAIGNGQPTLMGMIVTADGSDILRVTSMVREGPIGVVAFHLHAAERLRSLLSFQIEVPMITAATDHPETMKALKGNVECVACTVRAYRAARRHLQAIPITLVQYHVDSESIELLRRELQQVAE
jgi:GntR family transcriptional regulator